MSKIVIFSGGRDFCDRELFDSIMELYVAQDDIVYVGDCPSGLDAMVRAFGHEWQRIFKADWRKYGRSAGPRRNADMCRAAMEFAENNGYPVLLIAFPGGRGTASCVQQARRYGIPVMAMQPRI